MTERKAIAPPGHFFFGHRRELARNPIEFYHGLMREHGDVLLLSDCRRWGPRWREPFRWMFIAHPDDLRHVLVDNHRAYNKGELNREFRRMLGRGLLTSEGGLWRRQRRMLQPAFRRDVACSGSSWTPALEATDALCERLERSNADEFVDLSEAISLLTMDLVCRNFFYVSLPLDTLRELWVAMHTMLEYVSIGSFAVYLTPDWLPTPKRRRFYAAASVIDAAIGGLLAETSDSGKEHLMAHMRSVRDKQTGEGMPARLVHDEAVTVLHAGQNTLASALIWSMMLLDRYPDVREALQDEGSRFPESPTQGDVEGLEETLAFRVFLEAIRLFPPAWGGVREALVADEIGGATIAPGSPVVFSQYVTHRHPDFWRDPETFDPDRFLKKPVAERHPCAYFPFGAGPRKCIGEHFAKMAGPLILLRLHGRLRIRCAAPVDFRPKALLDLEPVEHVWAFATPV